MDDTHSCVQLTSRGTATARARRRRRRRRRRAPARSTYDCTAAWSRASIEIHLVERNGCERVEPAGRRAFARHRGVLAGGGARRLRDDRRDVEQHLRSAFDACSHGRRILRAEPLPFGLVLRTRRLASFAVLVRVADRLPSGRGRVAVGRGGRRAARARAAVRKTAKPERPRAEAGGEAPAAPTSGPTRS